MSQMYIYHLSITAEQKGAWMGFDDFVLQMLNTCYPFFPRVSDTPIRNGSFSRGEGVKKGDYEGCVASASVCALLSKMR